MSHSDQEIISRFPVGYYTFHPNVSLNFQMNRFYGWTGEAKMLDELKDVGPRIANYDDWTSEMLKLSDQALAEGRLLPAAYYSRGAQFFLDPSDSRFQPAFERFLDNVLAGNDLPADSQVMVPYEQTQLTAYRFTPDQPRGTLVVFGGYDSYIAEWLPAALAFRDAGLDTVIFDGPGQGTVLDAGVTMTPDWHLPVAAILDYFDLSDVTLAGFSLGGGLVVRAAAKESRVSRVIAWDVCTDLFVAATRGFDDGLSVIAADSAKLAAEATNAAVDAVSDSDLLTKWVFAQGERVLGAASPADVFKGWHEYTTADLSPDLTQDVLLMAGTKDHYMPLRMLSDQLLTLTGARSVAARVFTEEEQAQNHCQTGNSGLAIQVILHWMDAMGGRAPAPQVVSTSHDTVAAS